jgi:hypothetical protein
MRKSGFEEGCTGGEVGELEEERAKGCEDSQVMWEDREEDGAGLSRNEKEVINSVPF